MGSDAITRETVDFLLSDVGRAAAAALVGCDLGDDQLLPSLTELRRRFSPEQAGALVSLTQLRRRAAAKFSHADRLFFTAEALEQATAWPVAEHHAAWIDAHAEPGPLLDLGCGIGGDTLALAQHRSVIAYERDPLRLRLAAANAAAVGLAHRIEFRLGDWMLDLAAGRLPPAAAAYADPARRVEGRRVFKLQALEPPLSALIELQRHVPALGVKVMPGVDDGELPRPCGVEFISHAGVCKEAVLWFGPLAQHARWASVHTAEGWRQVVAGGDQPPLGPLRPGDFLHEPDPAVIRAGALAELCIELEAHLFDPQIAYLVTSEPRRCPLVQSFAVLEVHPFRLKLLNRRLAALGIGQVELKKRGFPGEPEALRKRLKLADGDQPGVVIFTRRGDEHWMVIAQRAW